MTCRPHRWNYEAWLPLIRGSNPEQHDSIRCLNCGRVLKVVDMSMNMKAAIANSLAARLFYGDEYSEVYDSVFDFLHRRRAA